MAEWWCRGDLLWPHPCAAGSSLLARRRPRPWWLARAPACPRLLLPLGQRWCPRLPAPSAPSSAASLQWPCATPGSAARFDPLSRRSSRPAPCLWLGSTYVRLALPTPLQPGFFFPAASPLFYLTRFLLLLIHSLIWLILVGFYSCMMMNGGGFNDVDGCMKEVM